MLIIGTPISTCKTLWLYSCSYSKLKPTWMQALGWLVTAVNVFKAVVVSTLLYGCGSWTDLTKTQEELIESIQRQCLLVVLDITNKCSYKTLLHVTGILPAVDVVKKTKITFINDLFHIKGKGICKEVLEKEYQAGKVKGLIQEVKEICEEIGVEDVTTTYVRPELLKEKLEGKSKCQKLTASLSSKSAPFHYPNQTNKQREYFTYVKEKAKLALSYDVGCLNLRANRRTESLKKFGSTQCLVPGCVGEDDLEHIIYTCQGYKVKIKDKGIAEEFIDTLYDINQQRIARFNTSMVNWRS